MMQGENPANAVYWQIICEAAAFVLSGELEGFLQNKIEVFEVLPDRSIQIEVRDAD